MITSCKAKATYSRNPEASVSACLKKLAITLLLPLCQQLVPTHMECTEDLSLYGYCKGNRKEVILTN